MGIDLKVMASNFREHDGKLVPTATVAFDRQPALIFQLSRDAQPCLVRPLPVDLKCGLYGENGLTFTDTDRYGKPLTFTTPADLPALKLPMDVSQWNHAVLDFLRALPRPTRLILYWW